MAYHTRGKLVIHLPAILVILVDSGPYHEQEDLFENPLILHPGLIARPRRSDGGARVSQTLTMVIISSLYFGLAKPSNMYGGNLNSYDIEPATCNELKVNCAKD
ncbi:uncharacterized protein FFB20_09116 [Fusarium fujikuroi]|uniref:Uncharacterized protein n=2 Tax=Fusarium fujikuroi TaxID=5127 RepID=S0ENF4_GIBF5|nr:uncharacterized protein FFUJ_14198 [Fusarium fujikuroi IMI 58289]KLO90123.1 uncharacterized protein Y057_8478 [Fusarium fujikuroi]QGI71359.1 hypothetical protein CEK27_003688 [Fusarium fujikuroi]QGJ02252.1 hypothetical protein CEK26_003696 [Fusarium fujikuroi]CCT76277.1 uncharacterized protein FFUJ_14198 [Fusarium fujikuroi IMI 58289]SCN91993.1 uncharacterized protein FFB20_09116 [Fusarium fujikuroi]